MPTFDPTDLIGRTFLLPPEENGERHRAKVTRKVVEIIDQENGHRLENINFILLPPVRNSCYTSFHIKNFPRRISEPEKTTYALSVYY